MFTGYAQGWADSLAASGGFSHDTQNGAQNVGENIYKAWGSSSVTTRGCQFPCDSW